MSQLATVVRHYTDKSVFAERGRHRLDTQLVPIQRTAMIDLLTPLAGQHRLHCREVEASLTPRVNE
ncbi:hypothetical protein EB241_05270 [Erwinia psidii]|uniref:Uncharacterized protein n=1 Tax=Erwinia psidii TaxID=69224 RepID=A0A3N6UT22_9GAMM|nr:hypothetical protein EB241_05270 [Erwinia psidii]